MKISDGLQATRRRRDERRAFGEKPSREQVREKNDRSAEQNLKTFPASAPGSGDPVNAGEKDRVERRPRRRRFVGGQGEAVPRSEAIARSRHNRSRRPGAAPPAPVLRARKAPGTRWRAQ